MGSITLDDFKINLDSVKERLNRAAERSGRSARDIEIMAVTKTFPASYISIARQAGIILFGENRVQEAALKYGSSDEQEQSSEYQLHLIGHLQRNKAKKAVETFSCIQSIDKYETAQAVDRYCLDMDKKMDILLEINTSGEESKFGFCSRDQFFLTLEKLLKLKALSIRGLMTVGPFTSNAGIIMKAFSELKELYEQTKARYPDLKLNILSMGMSGDYEIAVEQGSTMVRLGTALFGIRE